MDPKITFLPASGGFACNIQADGKNTSSLYYTSPTLNCQLGTLAGAEYLLEIGLLAAIIKKSPKPLVLIDVRASFKEEILRTLEKNKLRVVTMTKYTSTNESEMLIMIIYKNPGI